jgi:hypothetical protein
MICPHCNNPIDNSLIISESAKIRGSIISPVKSKKSAANGKHGGRPVGSKDSVKRKIGNGQIVSGIVTQSDTPWNDGLYGKE